MPSNRDYTGLIRTPSSMAWLIGQRARVKGRLDRLQRLEATLPELIRAAEAELRSLDAVIPLHEVKVEPQAIQGKRSYAPRLADSGELTRFVYKKLRLARGTPVYTAEIAFQFIREFKIDSAAFSHAEVMNRIGKRLRVLVDQGIVRRHHPTSINDPVAWSFESKEGSLRGE
jgi:hypothetical protein